MEPSFAYSIPYVLFAFTLGVLALCWHVGDERAKRWSVTGSIALFMVFIGLRGLIMSDWQFYYYFFNDHCTWNEIFHLGGTENFEKISTVFGLYNLFFKSIFDNWYFFTFCHLAIELALLYRFYTRNGIFNIPLALMIFYCLEGNVILCNLLRNGLGLMLCLNALEYIEKKEFWKYLAWVVAGTCFHYTLILFVPLYFVLNCRLNKYWFAAFVLTANIIYLLRIPIVMGTLGLLLRGNSVYSMMFEEYTEVFDTQASGITFGYIEKLITSVLVFLYYDELMERRKDARVYLNALMLYLFLFLSLSEFAELAKRISMMFFFGYWVIWYDLIKCFYYANNRRLFCFFVGIFCLFRLANGCKFADYQYDNALFGPKSDVERISVSEMVHGNE